MLDRKFDLIISLGEACGCSLNMKKFKLRDYSYPFDWLYGATLEQRIALIERDFEGFLLKDNLDFRKGGGDRHHDYYKDRNTDLCFIHDFPQNEPFDESYPEVYAKYQRRIKRFYEMPSKVDNILFIWYGLHTIVPEEAIVKYQQRLARKFNKKIHLLVIENDSSLDKTQDLYLNEFAMKIKGPFFLDEETSEGNVIFSDTVFSRITGEKKYLYVVLRSLMRVLCCFVPSGKLRRKIRTAYEKKW